MARPEVSELAETFYAALGFHQDTDEANDWALLKFVAAWVSPLDPVYEIVRERDDAAPWAVLFDVDNCLAESLPYLAQYVGVVLTPEMDEEQQRNEIREPTGWKRGQEPSIRIAVQRTLEDDESLVIIHPRTPEVGHTYVRSLLSQTPDPARTAAIVRAAVPAWEVLSYEAINGVTIADVAASANWETVADLAADFSTVQALTEILPTEI
jgi:hypothetical protein